MKVAISYTGIEAPAPTSPPNCRTGTSTASPRIRRRWNPWLGRIEVEGGSDAQKNQILHRRLACIVRPPHRQRRRRPLRRQHRAQTAIRQGRLPHHNFDALWGAQWSLNVLWPLAWPEVMDGFAETMVNMYTTAA